jgi:uncharacterized protein with HEPN domain
MPRDERAYLYDMQQAGGLIRDFTAGLDFAGYLASPMARAAVERQFEIIGEALNQLARLDPELVEGITAYRRIIAFRNILAHGYAGVDDRLVWEMASTRLDDLLRDVDRLLGGS